MNIPITQSIGLLRDYLRPQIGRVFLLGLFLLSGVGLQLVSPQILRSFIDSVSVGGTLRALLLAAALFLVVVLIERVAAVATAYVGQQVAWTATNGLRRDLTYHVLNLDMGFHNAHTPGELLERIDGDVDGLANFFSEFLLQILTGLLLAVGVLILLYQEDWRLGATLSVFVLAYVIVHYRGQKLAAPYWEKEREYTADMVGFAEERIAGVRDIQTNGAVPYTNYRFIQLLRNRARQALLADVVTDVGWTISKIFYDVGTTAGMALGAYLFLRGQITLGTVYLIISYLALLNGPLNRIAHQLEDLQRVRVAINRISQLVSTQSKIADGPLPRPSWSGPLTLDFENVSFAYSDDTPVLRDISFQLAAGETLGLLGRTGSGKTTISRLLFRLYDPTSGVIRLGTLDQSNADLRDLRLADLRDHIGIVTQDVQLFQATVRENLTLFATNIADGQIISGLAQLGLDGWLNELPDGLDTQLEAEGRGLSAGEAQLLALARVFLKDPGLVILDEASSRLDRATEKRLEFALDKLLQGRTSIIIAHRLSTVRRADHILVLEDGTVEEIGKYDELANDPHSAFARLLKSGQLDLDDGVPSDAMDAEAAVAEGHIIGENPADDRLQMEEVNHV